ncbi:hypothetical protein OPQ81_009888 [Rhizoctonia solani]|nr:hypothetical protein OPQ81_009888 [Rhizoctonia solani]
MCIQRLWFALFLNRGYDLDPKERSQHLWRILVDCRVGPDISTGLGIMRSWHCAQHPSSKNTTEDWTNLRDTQCKFDTRCPRSSLPVPIGLPRRRGAAARLGSDFDFALVPQSSPILSWTLRARIWCRPGRQRALRTEFANLSAIA